MKKVSTLEERLSALLDNSGVVDSAVAEAIGVSRQALSSWRTGVRSPKESAINSLADYFNVDPVWLMGYDVPQTPVTAHGQQIEPSRPPDYIPKTPEARTLAVGLDRMTPEKRELAMKMVQLMFDQVDLWEDSNGTKT